MKIFGGLVALLVAVFFLMASTAFVVTQNEQALVLQFGKPVRVEKDPGLKFKVPFVQNVEYYDKRLLDFDAEPKEVICADQKRLIVDAFVRYRITDPLRFKQTVTNESTMQSRLNSILESSLREVLGEVPLQAVISDQRAEIMTKIRDLVNTQAAQAGAEGGNNGGFGIDVVDVRIMRADLPPANSEGIYTRMKTEREREAKQFRAQGAEEAQKIRSEADKQRTILLAEAQKQAETTRGEGDGQATKIFAQAFGQDEDFFQFYRTMEAYRKDFTPKDTTMVVSPNSEFLQYLEKGSTGGHSAQ